MKTLIKNLLFLSYLGLLFSFLVIKPADAYIDPGTGSILIQIIVGGIIGISIALKVFWGKITSVFSKKK
jgi:hypothetical protein